jgi:choline dehydrogenase-like flavoprotein
MQSSTFEYIIVGGGAAGCRLANRPSANASKRALMVEACSRGSFRGA